MKERPILFSGSMVRAILEGRKSQTRRVVKPQPEVVKDDIWDGGAYLKMRGGNLAIAQHARNRAGDLCPYGTVGDRLWVRETWRAAIGTGIMFKADGAEGMRKHYPKEPAQNFSLFKWRPSIFMRREYSRINLEIITVRVERLQQVGRDDAIAEGMTAVDSYRAPQSILPEPESQFADGWDVLNAKRGYSWLSNPWVWVIEFKKL